MTKGTTAKRWHGLAEAAGTTALAVCGLLLLALVCAGAPAARERPLIAAASDLRFAMPDLVEAFEARTGRTVEVTFGSSGNITRQIARGAPFELFLSADEQRVLDLADQGLTVDEGRPYAVGRLSLYAGTGSPLAVDTGLGGLEAALADGTVRRFAIANPDHAPYGRAAREALTAAGLWESIEPRLVMGENAAQAAQFAASGAAQGGILAHSLALAPELSERGRSVPVPAHLHRPLRQRMVLMRGAGETARAFYDFLGARRARAILGRHGFDLPDGD